MTRLLRGPHLPAFLGVTTPQRGGRAAAGRCVVGTFRRVQPFAPIAHAEVDGAALAYRRAGSGPPVVLLHGIPTSSRLWDAVGGELAERFDVIALDMLGYGDSDKPLDRDVSIAAQAELLSGLLDQLGIERAMVVGHDIGGGVAQISAVRHPERLAALGLINAVCFDSWPVPAMTALKQSAPLVSRLPPGWVTKTLERGMRREVTNSEAHGSLAAALAAWDGDSDTLQAFFRNVEALDSRHTQEVAPRLREIDAPTHVIWGASDRYQKPEYAPRLRDAIPAATLRLLDAGHFVPWERPTDVARELSSLADRAQ